jgi:perosamine synthetase
MHSIYIIVSIIVLSIATMQVLYLLWLWQIKEYRLDRLRVHIDDMSSRRGILTLLGIYGLMQRRTPVWTKKIILLFLLSEIQLFIALYASWSITQNILFVPLVGMVAILATAWVAWTVFAGNVAGVYVKRKIIERAKKKMRAYDGIVIAITGSYGKSSTKEIVATLLKQKYNVHKTPKNTNTEIGVAKTVLQDLRDEHEIFVVEAGAYTRGEIRAICDIVHPTISMLTGINEQHSALFKGVPNTIHAKFEIVEALGSGGAAFVNGENEHVRQNYKRFSSHIEHIHLYTKAFLKEPGLGQALSDTLSEDQKNNPLILNVIGAAKVARFLGCSNEEILRGIQHISFPTYTEKKGPESSIVIDSTYNSNSDGVLLATEYFSHKYHDQKKIVAFSGIIELGDDRQRVHAEIGKKFAEVFDTILCTNADFAPSLKEGIRESSKKPEVIVCENTATIARLLTERANDATVIFLASRKERAVRDMLIPRKKITKQYATKRLAHSPIATAISPNAEHDDVLHSLGLLCLRNWSRWKKGGATRALEHVFAQRYDAEAISFQSGRVALYAYLHALAHDVDTDKNEILIQGFTTIALPNAITWAGMKPVFVDIDPHTLNMGVHALETAITPKTRAVIVQHTFGIPADIEKIRALCDTHNVLLIEDCAHSLGARVRGQEIGTFGDVAFFSFGRDKIISSVSGGMLVVKDKARAQTIREFQVGLPYPTRRFIFTQLFHPVAFSIILSTYYWWNIGKVCAVVFQKIGLLDRAYGELEKRGVRPKQFARRLANAQALRVLHQWQKIERFNEHRREIAHVYQELLPADICPHIPKETQPTFMYFTVRVPNRDSILNHMKDHHIILGNWFPDALGPRGIDVSSFGYQRGDCPHAEVVGKQALNLPTHIHMTENDARVVSDILRTMIDIKHHEH